MKDDLILRVVGKLMIPFILLFALYVQFHGDFGPGGGFQAGVIIAAGIIFYGLIHGIDTIRRIVPGWLVETALASGVLIYAGVGLAGLFFGGGADEADLLVVTDHLGGDARRLCRLADVHVLSPLKRFSRSALVTTKTLESAMAPAASAGESWMPKAG